MRLTSHEDINTYISEHFLPLEQKEWRSEVKNMKHAIHKLQISLSDSRNICTNIIFHRCFSCREKMKEERHAKFIETHKINCEGGEGGTHHQAFITLWKKNIVINVCLRREKSHRIFLWITSTKYRFKYEISFLISSCRCYFPSSLSLSYAYTFHLSLHLNFVDN